MSVIHGCVYGRRMTGVLLGACLLLAGCGADGRFNLDLDLEPLSVRGSDNPHELTHGDILIILRQAEAAAQKEPSVVRVNAEGQRQTTRMNICVVNRRGAVVGRTAMPDTWLGAADLARAKAYTALAFSSDQNALSSRSIGVLSQPGGPLWQIGRHGGRAGIVEFPGGIPLYKNGRLVGAIGVSGDGVEEEENVAEAGSRGYEAPQVIRIDTLTENAIPYTR